MSNKLHQAITAIKRGNKVTGRQLLVEIIDSDPRNEDAWLWMATVVEFDESCQQCLEKVLELNPDNEMAQKGLAILYTKSTKPSPRAGSFRINPSKPALSIWSGYTKGVYLAIFIGMLFCGLPMAISAGIPSENLMSGIVFGLIGAIIGASLVALPVAMYIGLFHHPYKTVGVSKTMMRLLRVFLPR
jgi:hypothetical protein